MKMVQKTILLTSFTLFSALLSIAQAKKIPFNIVNESLARKNYVGLTLQSLYSDFKSQLKEVIWSDEPPAKLNSALFEVKDSDAFLKVDLKVIPETARFNVNRKWTMEMVGASQILSIKLIKGNSIIYRSVN
jgi:hypothetical protein